MSDQANNVNQLDAVIAASPPPPSPPPPSPPPPSTPPPRTPTFDRISGKRVSGKSNNYPKSTWQSSMAARFTKSRVMNVADCLVGIDDIRARLQAAADQAIPEAIAVAISKDIKLLEAIADNEKTRNALGITDASKIMTDAGRKLIIEEAMVASGGRKSRKSRKMKKSRKPKRGNKSNKRKRTRKH